MNKPLFKKRSNRDELRFIKRRHRLLQEAMDDLRAMTYTLTQRGQLLKQLQQDREWLVGQLEKAQETIKSLRFWEKLFVSDRNRRGLPERPKPPLGKYRD